MIVYDVECPSVIKNTVKVSVPLNQRTTDSLNGCQCDYSPVSTVDLGPSD